MGRRTPESLRPGPYRGSDLPGITRLRWNRRGFGLNWAVGHAGSVAHMSIFRQLQDQPTPHMRSETSVQAPKRVQVQSAVVHAPVPGVSDFHQGSLPSKSGKSGSTAPPTRSAEQCGQAAGRGPPAQGSHKTTA